jgi:hypothetical protein
MFWIYTSGEYTQNYDTLPAVNQLLDTTASNTKGIDTTPFITELGSQRTVSCFLRAGSSVILSTQYFDETSLEMTSSNIFTVPSEHSEWLLANGGKLVKVITFVDAEKKTVVGVVGSTGNLLLCHLSSSDSGIEWSDWQHVRIGGDSYFDACLGDATPEGTDIIFTAADGMGGITMTTFALTGSTPAVLATIVGQAKVQGPTGSVDDVASAKLVIVGETSLLFVSSIKENAVFAASLPVVNRWTRVCTGRYFDVDTASATFEDSASVALMLVADYGYCYNSHTHNTRAYPAVCDSPPTVTPYTLDYSYGLFSDWVSLIQSSECAGSSNCFAVTSCTDRILHGSYDQGSKPSTALLSLSTGAPLFVELHEGLSSSLETALDTGCGEPYRRESIVVDAFSPISWTNNLLRTMN